MRDLAHAICALPDVQVKLDPNLACDEISITVGVDLWREVLRIRFKLGDENMSSVDIYSTGIVHCSVCAPRNMKPEDVAAEVNQVHPTGISSQWALSEDKEFADGKPNPGPCESDPNRRHYLMVC